MGDQDYLGADDASDDSTGWSGDTDADDGDPSVYTTFQDGTTQIDDVEGRTIFSPDGSSGTFNSWDRSRTETVGSDGARSETDNTSGTKRTALPQGTDVMAYNDGSSDIGLTDGTTVHRNADGTAVRWDADGNATYWDAQGRPMPAPPVVPATGGA